MVGPESSKLLTRVRIPSSAPNFAGVAQWAEREVANLEVAGSLPVVRSKLPETRVRIPLSQSASHGVKRRAREVV
jgi:hypothetical protein